MLQRCIICIIYVYLVKKIIVIDFFLFDYFYIIKSVQKLCFLAQN